MSLSKLYSDIVAKAAVDHDSPEIQDITSAMDELLHRLFSDEITGDHKELGFRVSLKLRCSSIQPCGSMTEKTSLWKSARRQGGERTYIEYDNLVVIDGVDSAIKIMPGDCQGCRMLRIGDHTLDCKLFVFSFLDAMYSRINNQCSCHDDSVGRHFENDRRDNRAHDCDLPIILYCRKHQNKCRDSRNDRPCSYCRIDRATGYLHIAKVADFNRENVKYSEHCSLVVYWTSHTGSLMAPNINTLELTERIKRLVIRVDILPAFVIPGNKDDVQSDLQRFAIPKICPRYDESTFMVSFCRYEWNAIHNAALEKHRQTFSIIKFLYGQFSYWTETDSYLKSYHAKVAFITHCETCTDDGEDCTRCLTDILQSLVEAYTSGSLDLPKFHALNTLNFKYIYDYDITYTHQLCISAMLSVVSELKNLAGDKQCNSQYRLRYVVDLIKRTCLAILEGKLCINETNGKPNFHRVCRR